MSEENTEYKYASDGVFNLSFFSIDGSFLFNTESVKNMKISNGIYSKNRLLITDGLIDNKLMNDVLNGVYKNMSVKIIGDSYYQTVGGEFKKVNLQINTAKIESYSCDYGVNSSTPIIDISFPIKDDDGFDNFKISIEGEDVGGE